MNTIKNIAILLASAACLLISCTKQDGHKDEISLGRPVDIRARISLGRQMDIGSGKGYTFVSRNPFGEPLNIGVRLTADALNGLPAEADNHILPMPGDMVLPFDHIEVGWNPQGHEPGPIYGVPHFDFHFYTISPQEQASIVFGPDNTAIDPAYIPQNYISAGVSEPNMGTHWVDLTSAEFNGQPFTTTFIYGSYHEKMAIFLEPMITKAFLESRPDTLMPIKQPQAFQRPGYYPMSYSISYDQGRKEYVIMLEGLKQH